MMDAMKWPRAGLISKMITAGGDRTAGLRRRLLAAPFLVFSLWILATVAVHDPGATGNAGSRLLFDGFSLAVLIFAFACVAVVWWITASSLQALALAGRDAARGGPASPDGPRSGEAASGDEQRFTADAAHAFKTPLTVLDLRLQRGEQGATIDWPAARADLAALNRAVSGHLALSRVGRAHAPCATGEINLARLAREAAAAFAPTIERRGRDIEVAAPSAVMILCAEAGELREMLDALIDNAVIHGAGKILIALSQELDRVVLTVSDRGTGVAAESREAVFDRFRKLDFTSAGVGLGLAIVRQIARRHGGEARFIEAATVEVRLRG